MGVFEGLGTELGLLNLLILLSAGATGGMLAKRLQLFLRTDWERILKEHDEMYAKLESMDDP